MSLSRTVTTFLQLCFVFLLTSFSGVSEVRGADGQSWDARTDYIGGLDQDNDPNDPWSYRAGTTNAAVSYGDLLTWKPGGQWGYPGDAYAASLTIDDQPVFGGVAAPTDSDELNEQVGGHGSWMLRWESPITGWVQVRGYIYRGAAGANNGRVINWKLLRDDDVVTEGFTPTTETGPLFGFGNQATFDVGNGGLRGTFINVTPGTRIDLITPGAPIFDGGISDWANTKYTIVEVDASDVPDADLIWDARRDFVEGLDQNINPNDPWSYHMGETIDRSADIGVLKAYGDLLEWRPQGQWGAAGESGGVYAFSPNDGEEDRPVLAGSHQGGGQDPLAEQIGGHGAYMIRWTSPIDSWVEITGYVYRGTAGAISPRRVNWRLLKNDSVFTQGATPVDADGVTPLLGYDNRVGYADGLGGLRGTFVEVSQGDRIDLITPGAPDFENGTPDWTNLKFTLTAVEASDIPTTRDIWDGRLGFVGGLDQTTSPNLPWTYHDADGNLLIWNEDALGSGPAYAGDDGNGGTLAPVVAGTARFGGQDPGSEQFGGHAPWMIRWTSPVTGTVHVDGYLYQLDDIDRLTQWQLLKNGGVVTEGLTPDDGLAPLAQYGNRVTFDSGSGGRAATFVDVAAGDTIDLVTRGFDQFGSPDPSAGNTKLTMVQVPGAPGNASASAGDNSATLSWQPVTDGGTFTITGYEVVQTSPLPTGVVVASVGSDATATTVTGLQSGVEYCYSVRAVASNDRGGANSAEVCAVPTQDTRTEWDVRADWADVDQNTAPNLPWTYRIGEPGGDFGKLLDFNSEGQWGVTPAYVRALEFEDRPVLGGFAVGTFGEDLDNEQIGGHGNFMVRWTSPVNSWVQVEGYIYQAEEAGLPDNRVMTWSLGTNGAVFTRGVTANDGTLALPGFANRVFFDQGTGGVRRTFFNVKVGDHIELLTPGTTAAGFSPTPTFVDFKLSVKIVDASAVPLATEWDATTDFVDGLDQTVSNNLPWSYRSAQADTSGQLLVWRPDGLFGAPAGYALSDAPGLSAPPILSLSPFLGDGPLEEQFGGHGAFMVRWTSSIAGTIRIDGYVYNAALSTPERVTNYQFLKNDVAFWEGFTAFDEVESLTGFANRVFFEDGGPPAPGGGANGLAGLTVDVSVGDNIDFITPGSDVFGDTNGTFVGAKLTYTPDSVVATGSCCTGGSCDIETEADCLAGGGSYNGNGTQCKEGSCDSGVFFRRGDHDGSGLVDITDPLNLLGFLFLGQTPPICEDASDADNSAQLDISDSLNSLGFLFLGSFPLNETLPGPTNCGPDPTGVIDPDGAGPFPPQPAESLGCDIYPSAVGAACP